MRTRRRSELAPQGSSPTSPSTATFRAWATRVIAATRSVKLAGSAAGSASITRLNPWSIAESTQSSRGHSLKIKPQGTVDDSAAALPIAA